MASSDNGILLAWRMDASGATPVDHDSVQGTGIDDGTLWVHLDRTCAGARQWLREVAGLDPFVVDALLEEETRPRVLRHGDGLLINLRGVNPDPEGTPEDMISVRLWLDPRRLFSLRGPTVRAADDVSRTMSSDGGPHTPGQVLVALAEALVKRTRPVIAGIEDAFDQFEEALTDAGTPDPSAARISAMRRRAIELRRHLAPQREVLVEIAGMADVPMSANDRQDLRQTADRVTRLVEDLDVARERGAVTHEEVTERLSHRMNRNMYMLSVVAAVFLPLSFITGLLGINVGGIPGAGTGWAFLAICGALAVILVLEVWYLRRRHWLD